MQYLWRRVAAPLPDLPGGESVAVGRQSELERFGWRSGLMTAALLVLLAQAVVLSVPSLHTANSVWSNLAQLILGVFAALAMVDAAWRSRGFARRTWLLAALAMGAYTAGQGMITYYGPALYRSINPNFKDQLFFFWMVPLLAAAAADPRAKRTFAWIPLLDFAQLVVLSLALHLFVFGDASRWQTDAQQMSFLKWKIRVIRDVIVLACLWGRAFASSVPQARSLFRRLGTFY